MGSLPPSPPSTIPSSPENPISSYRIYAPFCSREPAPNKKISNWIEYYNPSNKTWSRASSIPGLDDNQVLKDFAMISIGDTIYIIGGRLCRKELAQVFDESSDRFIEVGAKVLSTVSRYDISSDQWAQCASLSVPRYGFACAVNDNKIYVAGGESTLTSARGIAEAEMYDPLLDEWTSLPNMSRSRYRCVGVTWHGKIHVVSGFVESGISEGIVPYVDRCSAEVFDAQSGKWIFVARMWQLDVPPNQIVPVDGKLFSSGDCLNAWKGHIEAYDGMLNFWYIVEGSQLKSLCFPHNGYYANGEDLPPNQRLYLTVAPIGSHLYFLVGYRPAGDLSRTISVVHSFDTSVSRDAWPWRCFESMEEEGEKELCSHCCVVQL